MVKISNAEQDEVVHEQINSLNLYRALLKALFSSIKSRDVFVNHFRPLINVLAYHTKRITAPHNRLGKLLSPFEIPKRVKLEARKVGRKGSFFSKIRFNNDIAAVR